MLSYEIHPGILHTRLQISSLDFEADNSYNHLYGKLPNLQGLVI